MPNVRTVVPAAVAAFALTLALAGCVQDSAAQTGTEEAAAPTDLGSISFPTSATGPAQAQLERGVAALHSFWYPEAEAAFRAAREADPGFAMAYWGEAMTHNHPIWNQVELSDARAVLEMLGATAAERAAKAPTEREKAYLAAAESLFFGAEEKSDRDAAYERAMADLAARWPDDVDAGAFHALALEGVVYGGADESRRFPLLMRAAAELEELFDRAPEHPGVLHYLIHAYDDPVHAPLGLRAATVYARVAPAAHHALHMPSHIFVQLGLWDRAEASNRDAWRASVAWADAGGHGGGHHDFHSLAWLLYAQLQQGKLAAGAETLAVVRAEAEKNGEPPSYFATMEAMFAIESAGEIDAAAIIADSGVDFRSGEGALWLAEADAARRAGDAARAGRAAARLQELADAGGGRSVDVMAKSAAAFAAMVGGRSEEAVELAAAAVALEEEMPPPSGPPDTIKPAHELHAELLLAAGRPAEAAEAFAAALARTPRRAAALLGSARAARALGDAATAAERFATLNEIWRDADPRVPGLDEVRRAAAGDAPPTATPSGSRP